jgi:hypothetical protein
MYAKLLFRLFAYEPVLTKEVIKEQLARNLSATVRRVLQRRNIETNIPIKGNERPQCQFPHSCVCDRYIPTIGLFIVIQENMWTDHGNIKIAHRYMNVEIGTEAALFLSWDT